MVSGGCIEVGILTTGCFNTKADCVLLCICRGSRLYQVEIIVNSLLTVRNSPYPCTVWGLQQQHSCLVNLSPNEQLQWWHYYDMTVNNT